MINLDKAKTALQFFADKLGHKVDCGKEDCFACHCRRYAQKTLEELKEDVQTHETNKSPVKKAKQSSRSKQEKTKYCEAFEDNDSQEKE